MKPSKYETCSRKNPTFDTRIIVIESIHFIEHLKEQIQILPDIDQAGSLSAHEQSQPADGQDHRAHDSDRP